MTSDDCVIHGSKSALHIAKENIEKWFPVAMVLEHRELSLKVMEAVLPRFFKDVFKVPHLSMLENKGVFLANLINP